MRIIRGTHGGRLLHLPKHFKLRPTTDLAKESLFNILENYFAFEELSVLDLFAGTGSISFEFASRGSRQVVAVEKVRRQTDFIRKVAKDFDFEIRVLTTDVFKYIKKSPESTFDIIFADPPYELESLERIPDLVLGNFRLNADGWLILEHSGANDFSKHPLFFETRKYGKVHFSFFKEK